MKRDEEEARKQAKKQEERRRKREERVAVVAELKSVAVKRRGEAQRLLRALLAGAAEERSLCTTVYHCLPFPATPYHSLPLHTTFCHFPLLAILYAIPYHSLLVYSLPLPIPCNSLHHFQSLTATRYQQEEAEKRVRLEQQHKEEMERKRMERVAEEASLRDKLIRNVQRLEQRRKEIQRELVLRDISKGSSQHGRPGHAGSSIPSAVVVPPDQH